MKLNFKGSIHAVFIAATSLLSVSHTYAHWNSKGPYGGSVSCMVTIDTNVLIGTYNGGVFINTTAGATTWKPFNQGMTSGKIGAITQLGRRIIAGTSDAGVFISTDRGNNWAASNSGLSNLHVQALAFSGSNLFAGTANGAFLSTDSGATWTTINTGLANTNVTSFAVNGTTIYAATAGGGVFTSTNAGTSWAAINTGLSGPGLTLNAIVADGSMLYAANSTGVYMYMGSWSAFNTGLTSAYVTSLSMSGSTLYAATDDGIFQSTMMGAWSAAGSGLPAADTATAVAVIGSKIFAGTKNNGLFGSPVSTISFATANNGFNNLKTYAMVTQDTNTIFTATNKGLFISTDLAASYSSFNTGLIDSLNVNCLLIDGVMKFAGTKNAGVFASMSGGAWSALSTGLVSMDVRALAAVAGSSPKVYAATADGKIYSITPAAMSWTDESTGLPSGLNITSIAVDGSMLYIGAKGGGVYHYMGGSWMAMNTGLTNLNVTALVVLDGNVYAGTLGGGVFKAAMMGNWTAVNTGLPSMDILSLNAAAPYIVAGYRGGVYVTNNGAASWEIPGVIANIPPFADVTSLSIAKTRVFAGTADNSLYSNANSELPAVSIADIGQQAVGSVRVLPNPNSGTFELRIADIQVQDVIEVSIYDMTGRKVQQLDNQLVQQVKATIGNGIYLISITTTKGSNTQKIIIQ